MGIQDKRPQTTGLTPMKSVSATEAAVSSSNTVPSVSNQGLSSGTQSANTQKRVDAITDYSSFFQEYSNLECFRSAVNDIYQTYNERITKKADRQASANATRVELGISPKAAESVDLASINNSAAKWTHKNSLYSAQTALQNCISTEDATTTNDEVKQTSTSQTNIPSDTPPSPFDRRLDRLFISEANTAGSIRTPFSAEFKESAVTGLIVGEKYLTDSGIDSKSQAVKRAQDERKNLQNDNLYTGVPALQNTYALTKLYGSDGGDRLINKRGERRWYEVDLAFGSGTTGLNGFSTNPTTSSLIDWGQGDPYGRTPYHFTDFVFAKYWKKIENNRLITLRRYGAPILDNLKFPGMDGAAGAEGTSGKVLFPPMAHAVTYFGGDTGNNLNDLLKFTSGMNWDEIQSDVWKVGAESTPDNESGPGIFKGLANISKMLNVAGGNFDPQLIMNDGNLPPDPYSEGPYENRILGPVNRIDKVKKRAAGLTFEWSGLNLVFEYVARPVGGVNPKAVLLDILSNFLIIGSASAVFFGGQHRFMANPAKYPFLGGQQGIESWYNGRPMEWANDTITQFAGQTTNPDGSLMQGAKSFYDTLVGGGGGISGGIKGLFGAVKGLFTDGGIGSNMIKGKLAEKSSGAVPYLTGMKALLTGEPVGEWHVTIGNPLNPIAMIGNLICTGIEVEFGEELGLDDFPTELKMTVKMDHGMPRDRDAIQSVFNRGMGRIYDLPDTFEGSADGQSAVDNYTQTSDETGSPVISRGWLAGPSTTGSRVGDPVIKSPATEGNTSVWNHVPFRAVSPNDNLIDDKGNLARSAYRAVDWVALKSLK